MHITGVISAANLISDTRIPISQPLLSVPPMNSCGSRKEYTYDQNVQQPCRNLFQITKARQWNQHSTRIAADCSLIIEPQCHCVISPELRHCARRSLLTHHVHRASVLLRSSSREHRCCGLRFFLVSSCSPDQLQFILWNLTAYREL